MKPAQRILVIMPNWFGEVLFATPFLRVLRQARPDSFISALGVIRGEEMLANNPDFNEFIVFDEEGLHRTFTGKRALTHVLRSRRFDTAFILRKSLTRTFLLMLAGIPQRIGFDNPKSGWLLTDRVKAPPASTHKAHAYLRLLKPLGISVQEPPSYGYYVTDQERANARRLLQERGLAESQSFLVLHPGANWPHKRWPPERFAELAERLIQQRHEVLVITGGPDDEPLVAPITQRLNPPPILLIGRTTLRGLAAVLEQARLVVSNDTGVLHIACALRRPVVALYGPTAVAITGPLGDPARTAVLQHAGCCPSVPCYRPHHPGRPGMASITVDEVYGATLQVLQQTAGHP